MTWQIFVTISHIIGTVLGVGGATFAEIYSWQKPKSELEAQAQSRFLHTAYTVIRIGMVLLILSGFGYFLLLRFEGHAQYIYSPRVWAKLTMTAIILLNAVLLQTRKIPFWLGQAVSLTSWYAALILGAWRGLKASYGEMIVWYVAVIFAVVLLERLIRKFREGETV